MFRGGGGVPILLRTLVKATGVVFAGIFTMGVVSAAINVNSQKNKVYGYSGVNLFCLRLSWDL